VTKMACVNFFLLLRLVVLYRYHRKAGELTTSWAFGLLVQSVPKPQ
jgi:hypothetical protein